MDHTSSQLMSGGEDIWLSSANGTFTVMSSWNAIGRTREKVLWHKGVRFKGNVPKWACLYTGCAVMRRCPQKIGW